MDKNMLKELRLRHRMTLQEVGEQCGKARGAICDLEKGKHVPRLDTARKIAAVFGVSVDEIWPLQEQPQ